MKPLPASYYARKLMNTVVPWTQPHRDEPGFARIHVAARMEEVLPQLAASLPAGDPAAVFAQLTGTLNQLKTTDGVDRTILTRGSAMLPMLIEQAREAEIRLHEAADPDHPMMRMMTDHAGPIFFRTSEPLFQYYDAQARRIALEVLDSGLSEINRAFEQAPPKAARSR